MKLKKVTVTFEYIMAVEDGQPVYKQYATVLNTVVDVFRDMSTTSMDVDITDYSSKDRSCTLPDGWTDSCIPYNGDNTNKTIAEYET